MPDRPANCKAPQKEAPEGEVTSEMVEAGTRVLWCSGLLDCTSPTDREVVRALIEAALVAKRVRENT